MKLSLRTTGNLGLSIEASISDSLELSLMVDASLDAVTYVLTDTLGAGGAKHLKPEAKVSEPTSVSLLGLQLNLVSTSALTAMPNYPA